MKSNRIGFKLCHIIFVLLILVVLLISEDSRSYAAMTDEIMTRPYSVTETGTNHAPTDVTLTNIIIKENSSVGTTVALINVVDEDASDTFRYILNTGLGSEDNINFAIIGNELRMITVPDFETKNSYAIRIRVFDRDDLWCERTFKISITDVNEAPTEINLSTNVVNENVSAVTLIGTLSTVDEDHGDSFYYSLGYSEYDIDNSKITLSGNTLRIATSPDYESRDNYTIKIRTTDSAGLSFEKYFIIRVIDFKENDTQITIPEQAPDNSPTQESEENENSFDGEDGEGVVYNKDSEESEESEDSVEIPSENKKEKEDSVNAKLLKLNGVIVKGSRFVLEVDGSLTSFDLNVTVSNAATWELYSDATCTKLIKSNMIKLKVGKNKIYIKVTSQDKKYEKTYSVILQKMQ